MRYYVQHVLFRFPSSYTRSAASQLLMHSGTRNADASYFNLLTEVLDASPLPFDHVPKKGVVGHSLLLQIFQCLHWGSYVVRWGVGRLSSGHCCSPPAPKRNGKQCLRGTCGGDPRRRSAWETCHAVGPRGDTVLQRSASCCVSRRRARSASSSICGVRV
jgi:hypothetical protein